MEVAGIVGAGVGKNCGASNRVAGGGGAGVGENCGACNRAAGGGGDMYYVRTR